MKINRLLLASTSPYRLALLKAVGIVVSPEKSLCDEDQIHAESPFALAKARSEGKGLAIHPPHDACLVISADQVLDFKDQAFDKAHSDEEAFQRLRLFAGHEHSLHSAYSLVLYIPGQKPRILRSSVVTAKLQMRALSDAEIRAYVATGEWHGCAGCYQYENCGMQLIDRIEGDMSTIIGLPLPALLHDLRTLGINTLVQAEGPWTISL